MDPIIQWIARGPVRGLIGRHRLESAAHKAVARDRRACKKIGGGSYSDAVVYALHKSGKMTGPYRHVMG
jgi:hypothetical protein